MNAPFSFKSCVTQTIPQSRRRTPSDGTDDTTRVSAVLGR